MSEQKVPVKDLILVPALITLAVTLLRLTGELLEWSPLLFNREAGGGGALVGIVWLVPVFGIYFAVKLARMGQGPASPARVLLMALAAFAVFALAVLVNVTLELVLGGFVLVSAASVAALMLPALAWPQLFRTLLFYGLAARVPVMLIMLVAILSNWGTHYEQGPPGFPEMGPLAKFFWIGLIPQATIWIWFTVAVGSLFGGVIAFFVKGPQPAVAEGA